jgi:hypothetical protein
MDWWRKFREFFPISGRKRPQPRENTGWGQKRGGGTGSDVAPRSPSPRGNSLPGTPSPQVRRPPLPGAGQAVSLGRIRPPADLVKPRNVRIVSDGSVGRSRWRTLRPIPQFQMPQDPFDDHRRIDQAYDLEPARAMRANQGIGFLSRALHTGLTARVILRSRLCWRDSHQTGAGALGAMRKERMFGGDPFVSLR